MTVHEYISRSRIHEYLNTCRESRRLILVIVAIALFLDNMLLTTVVPIIPEFLYAIRHRGDPINVSEEMTEPTISLPLTTEMRSIPEEGNVVAILPDISKETVTPETEEKAVKVCPCSDSASLRPPPPTNTSDEGPPTRSPAEQKRHEELISENVEVGVMFASKAVVQLITNPFVGPITNRIGYSIPMFCGFVIMFLSTLIFAFGRSYSVLFIARALQGIGSSCSSVSGMGMLADRFPDDKERGNAMGLALGGLAMGVLVGPPFGGVMYQFVGKTAPFLILATLALGDGLLQLLVLQPAVQKQDSEGAALLTLIQDPYIILAAGAITFANMGIAMLEPSLPIYMMDTMHSSKLNLGVAFLPASISYLIGTNLFGPLGHRIGRWLASLIGLIIIGICLMCIPLAKNIFHLIGPNAGLGFAIGMVDSSMMPELGFLVDIRHSNVYGSVYAIGDVAFCLGFAIGPAMSGKLVQTIGFGWMLFGIAIINFLYAPLMIFLRNPPGREENKSLILNDQCPVRYVNYNQMQEIPSDTEEN